jgi:hypothetical protein
MSSRHFPGRTFLTKSPDIRSLILLSLPFVEDAESSHFTESNFMSKEPGGKGPLSSCATKDEKTYEIKMKPGIRNLGNHRCLFALEKMHKMPEMINHITTIGTKKKIR